MPATIAQFVFRPNPGADLAEIVGLAKEASKIWRDHGAQEVKLWAVQIGEVGNFAFVVRCDSAAKLGQAIDGVNSDPAFLAWRAKNLKLGAATWVRSNQAYEIAL